MINTYLYRLSKKQKNDVYYNKCSVHLLKKSKISNNQKIKKYNIFLMQ